MVNLGSAAPVVEKQIVDDFVFAAGQTVENGSNMLFTATAFWDEPSGKKDE